MASGTITLNSTRDVLEGRIVWSSSSNGSSANSSNVYAEIQGRRNDGYTTTGTWTGSLNVGGKSEEFSFYGAIGSNWTTVKSLSNTVKHNDDGKGSCYIYGKCNGPSGTSMSGHYVEGSSTVTLDTIPRYAKINSFSIKSKTINTIILQYSVDSTIDKVQYMFEGGSWADLSSNGLISNLNANTKYKIRIQVKRKDSQLWTASSYISVTTYDYAKLSSVPNINIGSSHTITWTNPSGASTSLKLCKTDNTQIINYGTVTGTSKSITPTASTIYALTPNSNTYKARYILTTTQNGKTYTNYKDFTFTVTNSNPTFSNFTYKDTNATTVALTGNNQILVRGYSNVSATIPVANKATAKNSATMKTYKLVNGSKSTNTKAYSSTADVTLDTIKNIDSGTLVVYATDSRGNSTSVTKNVTYKQYTDLVIKTVTAERGSNGVGQDVTLKFNGTYWNSSFGSVSNTITNAKYYYKETNSNIWIEGKTELTFNMANGNYSGSASIKGDLEANGFDVSKSFNIRLQISDKLITKTYDLILGSGTPAIAIYKNNVAIGQKYDKNVGGALQLARNSIMSQSSGDVRYRAKRTDTGVAVWFGVGSSGTNHGVYSEKLNKWLLYADANNNVYVNDYKISSASSRGVKSLTAVGNSGWGTNNNYVPDMSFIAYWNGRYSATGSNLTYCSGGTIQPKPTTLYDNSSGTTGTITLSQTAANFSYLEIFYVDNAGNQAQSIRVPSPNGKTITLDNIEPNSSGLSYAYQRISSYSISGTSITRKNSVYIQHNPSNSPNINTNTYIKIVKVLGYK